MKHRLKIYDNNFFIAAPNSSCAKSLLFSAQGKEVDTIKSFTLLKNPHSFCVSSAA
jgi:hypothetical protein